MFYGFEIFDTQLCFKICCIYRILLMFKKSKYFLLTFSLTFSLTNSLTFSLSLDQKKEFKNNDQPCLIYDV